MKKMQGQKRSIQTFSVSLSWQKMTLPTVQEIESELRKELIASHLEDEILRWAIVEMLPSGDNGDGNKNTVELVCEGAYLSS